MAAYSTARLPYALGLIYTEKVALDPRPWQLSFKTVGKF